MDPAQENKVTLLELHNNPLRVVAGGVAQEAVENPGDGNATGSQKIISANAMKKIAILKLKASKVHKHAAEKLADKFAVQKLKRLSEEFSPHELIHGAPPTHANYKFGLSMFLIHLLYPLGPLYVYFAYGRIPFRNLAFTCNSPGQFISSHLPFFFATGALFWVLVEPHAMEIYGLEVLIVYLSHISRLLAVGVKYAHCDPAFLHAYLHCEDLAAVEKASKSLMLPSGWFRPTIDQWFPIIDRAEHTANVSFALHNLTKGHGLCQEMLFVGDEIVAEILEYVKPYTDLDEVKERKFTCKEGRGLNDPGNAALKSARTLRVSIGLFLLAMVMDKSHEKKPVCFHPFVDMGLVSLFLSVTFTCVGIFYRIFALGQPGEGDYEWAGFFIFTTVFITTFNFWAFFNFTKIAIVDYKRRARLSNKLIDMIRPQLTIVDDEYFVLPRKLDFKYEKNAISFLILRQISRSLGKQYRLRLQWIISYALLLFAFFAGSFLVLVFSTNKSLRAPHYYGVIYCSLVTMRIIHAILAADEANGTAKKAIKFTLLQGLEIQYSESLKSKAREVANIAQYIEYDDKENPIRIIGFRADKNLLQGFLIGLLGAAATFVELAGIDLV